ncbi:MAG: DUF6602 domain-containing protein [Pseudomonadota bacterium]
MSGADNAYVRALDYLSSEIEGTVSVIRDIIGHSGEIGTQVERAFHSALTKVLPERVGVSSGFVLDSVGGISSQLDIILYDKHGVPPIFQDGELGIFPAEAVYAAGEVKTRLGSKEISDAWDKCFKFKSLDRSSQFIRRGQIQSIHYLYGKESPHWLPQFFTLAVESPTRENFHKLIRDTMPEISSYQMAMESICCLDGNLKIFMRTKATCESEEVLPEAAQFLSGPDFRWCTYTTHRPWALFSLLLTSVASQYPQTKVNMVPYARKTAF